MAVTAAVFLPSAAAWAQPSQPAGAAATACGSPTGSAYPGTIELAVDATDLDRHVFRINETIPLRPARR